MSPLPENDSRLDDGSKRLDVRQKFDWMYSRIQLPAASELAGPLHTAAIEQLEKYNPA